MSALYYVVRGQRGAQATSGGLQLDVSVGRSLESRYVWESGGGGRRANEQSCLVLRCVASCPNIHSVVPNI